MKSFKVGIIWKRMFIVVSGEKSLNGNISLCLLLNIHGEYSLSFSNVKWETFVEKKIFYSTGIAGFGKIVLYLSKKF